MDINKNIAIWRGSNTPPTPYHLWLKDNKLYHYDGISWKENKIDLSTEEKDGLMSKEDKLKLYNLEDRLNELNLSAYLIRGSVETLDDIPYENLLSGDVYNILNPFYIDEKRYPEGTNVVWTGDKLDPLGGTVDFKDYSTTEEVEDMISISSDELHDRINKLRDNIIDTLSDLYNHIPNDSNPHNVTKALVGLGNVTNDALVKRSEMGVAGGVATLDGTGKVPAALLPVYVDDVLEGTLINATTFQLVEGQQGEVLLSNVIYIDTITNKSYRWSGTQYVTIASDLALGETSSTAYPGDKGNAATNNINKIKSTALSHIDDTTPITYSDSKVTVNYECYEGDQYGDAGTKHGADIAAASETTAGVMTAADKNKLNAIEAGALVNTVTGVKGNSESSYRTGDINITKDNIGLSNVDNTSDINKPISTALLNALNQKVDKVEGKELSTNDYTTEEKNKLQFLSNLNLFYSTSELYDLSTPGHKANLNEIRINLNVMGVSMINSVSIIVASDRAYDGPLYMRIYDILGNLVSTSTNSVNLSLNLGQHVTWYFTPIKLTENAVYRFSAWDTSGTKQTIRIHCTSNKNEGIYCFDGNDSPHSDYSPAFGINIEPIVTNDILSEINSVKLGVTNVELLVSGKLLTLYVGATPNKYLLKDGDTIEFSLDFYPYPNTRLYILRCNDSIPIMNLIIPSASEIYAGLLTSDDYSKLGTIQREAQVNVIESIQVGGVELEISGKLVNIPIASSDDILSILN